MSLLARVCIYSNGSWSTFIPPYGMNVTVRPLVDLKIQPVPFANPQFIYGRKNGIEIAVSALYKGSTLSAALQFEETLNSALFDSGFKPRKIDFCRWYDSDSVVKGIYRSLYCASGPAFDNVRHNKFRSFSFSLQGLDPAVYTTGSAGTKPGASPYELLYPGNTGGTPAVPLSQIFVISAYFSDLIEVTGAGNVDRMQKIFTMPGSGTMHIIGLKIAGAEKQTGSSGSSTFKVSDANYAGAGNFISASVAYNAVNSALASGDLEIEGGDDFYLFPTATGGHGGVMIEMTVSS